jgi:SAM-dependent methyltransferase
MDTIIYPLASAGAHRSSLGRGSVMGLVMLTWGAASTVGPLLAGALADTAGDRAAYAAMMFFCALGGAWLVRPGRGRKRVATPSPRVGLDRLYGARDLDELSEEYERIATRYDAELVDGMGYRAPEAVAEAVRRLVDRNARILDVGAGTGLLGVALADAGFTHVDGMDLSPGMLAQAAQKRVYGDLREGRLGDALSYGTSEYDGVVASGVLTLGHAPASCLDELVRITRPGGRVIFTLRSDRVPPGFEAKIAELEQASRWELTELGEEFQAMPKGEPDVRLRVWAFRVL